MPTETGHAINLAHFSLLISYCVNFGPDYNPSNPKLKIPALQEKYTQAKEAQSQLTTAKVNFDNATNHRMVLLKEMKTLSTRMVNALQVSGASYLTTKDAKTILRKIRGQKAPKKQKLSTNDSAEHPVLQSGVEEPTNPFHHPVPLVITSGSEEGAEEHSTSQRSYDNQAHHFANLIAILQNEPKYNPNEPDLKITTIQQKYQQFTEAIAQVSTAQAAYKSHLIARNNTFYDESTSLIRTTEILKSYIKSLYGLTSPQYKTIRKIPFRKTF